VWVHDKNVLSCTLCRYMDIRSVLAFPPEIFDVDESQVLISFSGNYTSNECVMNRLKIWSL
jgi:hypothetical protein